MWQNVAMKANSTSQATRASQEDAEFLKKIRGNNRMTDVLMAAPARFLSASLDEVDFPVRFTNRIKEENVNSLADLLRVDFDSLKGRNLGARTIEVATESLTKFITKKINQGPLITLRDMMQDFGSDLLAREARIWEMRMGLLDERSTLDAIGTKFGLTRERVRQIEAVLFSQFSKKYPAVNTLSQVIREGMNYSALVNAAGQLLHLSDPEPLAGILEMLEPKFYFVAQEGVEPIISTSPRTEIDITFKRALNAAENIFRQSEKILDRVELFHALEKETNETNRLLAIAKLTSEGMWDGDNLLSPNRDKVNVAIGCLQASSRPIHVDELVENIQQLIHEDTTPEALRSALSLVPSVRSFGYGMVGFSRHVSEVISAQMRAKVIATVERIVQRGPDNFQWNTKDLLSKVQDKFLRLHIGHHELNVILHDSQKLAYLGRLTWVLKGESDKRRLYREIFVNILHKAGKPLPESVLVERAQKQRGFHLNVHFRNEVQLLEVSPKVWGLTERDNPFTKAEIAKLTKLFDSTFEGEEFTDSLIDNKGLDRKGVRASEIMKVIELKS